MINNYEPISMQEPWGITWKKAKNDIIIDSNNKKYIDFTSSIFLANVGHSNKRVNKYVKRQINKQLIHSYIYNNEPRKKFIKKLIEMTPLFCEKAFLLSSGTEATECAVKLMRMYTEKKKIISIKGSMHGRTMAAELMKGSTCYQHKDFIALPYPNKNSNVYDDLKNNNVALSEIAGFMIETYEGWSARFLPYKYINQIYEYCKNSKTILCFDEIQAGFFRTGLMFGFQHYHVVPDLICIGKAIGNGFPLSGVLGRSDILDVPKHGEMSSTHSANPISCIAGLATLEELERINNDDLAIKKDILCNKLCQINDNILISKLYHQGMLASVIFKNKQIADDIFKLALDRGVFLVYTGRESIKLGPPLTIKKNNLIKGLTILKEVIDDYKNKTHRD